ENPQGERGVTMNSAGTSGNARAGPPRERQDVPPSIEHAHIAEQNSPLRTTWFPSTIVLLVVNHPASVAGTLYRRNQGREVHWKILTVRDCGVYAFLPRRGCITKPGVAPAHPGLPASER